jgi:glycerol-3-phosphate acyltransferase PlsY
MIIKLFLPLVAYLIGSIPIGVILSKRYGKVDIQKEGSGNIGATNVYRTLGKKLGILTLLGDVLKGLIPVLISFWLLEKEDTHKEIWISLTALMVVIGHCYPLFLRFKGGKGVATALGAFLAIDPRVVPVALIIFALTFYKWRYVSLGSLLAAGSMPVLVALTSGSKIYIILALTIVLLIFYRHRENIIRLREGKEKKIGIRV